MSVILPIDTIGLSLMRRKPPPFVVGWGDDPPPRRRYSGSEADVRLALSLLFTFLIALLGGIYLVFRSGRFALAKMELRQDILAPRNKNNPFIAVFERLPPVVTNSFSAFLLFGVIGYVAGQLFVQDFVSGGMRSLLLMLNTVGAIGALISLAVCLPTLIWALWKERDALFSPPSTVTLFRDADAPLTDPKYQYLTYTIRLARGLEWSNERSVRFIEQLTYSFEPMLFRIHATSRVIEWQLVDLIGREPRTIENAIRVVYPEAQITISKAHDLAPLTKSISRLTLVYHPVNHFVHPLKYAKDVKELDPLAGVVSALSGIPDGLRVTFNIFVVGSHPDAYIEGEQVIHPSTIRWFDYLTVRGLRRVMVLRALGHDIADRYEVRDQRVVEDKLREGLYQAMVAVQVDGIDTLPQITIQVAQNIDSQMLGFAHMPYNALRWYTGVNTGSDIRTPPSLDDLILTLDKDSNPLRGSVIERITQYAESDEYKAARWATRCVLTPQELALLWHMPDDAFSSTRIAWLSARTIPPPAAVTDTDAPINELTYLGMGMCGGKPVWVGMPLRDRESHMRVIGKTGAGKSSFLQNLIKEDIGNGFGVAVMDPHGSLIESVLKYCIPPERANDVVIIDLADKGNPPPLNPLRGGLTYVQVGQIVQSIEKMFPTTRQYPRLSYYLRIALLTLNADPHATIRDVVRILVDREYRASLISVLEDYDLIGAWEDFDKMKETERRTITDPIRTRISPFFTNPDLAPMMCHPDGLDFESMIRERKIILVSLKMNEQRVPESERNLIGALLLSRLQVSGMQEATRVPYFVYIDEVQRFVTSSLDEMFSEARKFGLSLTVAHQFLDQLPDTTQSSLMSNVGASFLFASSPEDAKVFSSHLRPYFEIDEMVGLDQFTCIARVQAHGLTQTPFTLFTALPLGLTDDIMQAQPVFARRVRLIAWERSRLSGWAENWLKAVALENAEGDPYGLITAYLRLLSHALYTPRSRAAVLAWMKARYGRVVKEDNQAEFFDE